MIQSEKKKKSSTLSKIRKRIAGTHRIRQHTKTYSLSGLFLFFVSHCIFPVLLLLLSLSSFSCSLSCTRTYGSKNKTDSFHFATLTELISNITQPIDCSPPTETPKKDFFSYPPIVPDWIVLTTTEWKPTAERWATYRRSRGHNPLILTMSEILAGRPMTKTEFLSALHAELKKIRTKLPPEIPLHLMLLGAPLPDPKEKKDAPIGHRSVPTFSWKEKFYTDSPYADLDGDGLPDISLGRIPAKTPTQALYVLDKIIRYEAASPPGDWRHRILLFASEGDFGKLVDALLEKVGFQIVKHVPDKWKIDFIHARKHSPYTLPPKKYNDFLTQELNSGALLSIYLGHGYPETLDKARWSSTDTGPILDLETIPKIMCGPRCPVMILVACHTGRPLGGDGLAERLAILPTGPPAVIGSTEVSHPYPNALIVSSINREFLWLQTQTIGELFRNSLQILRAAPNPRTAEIEDLAGLVWNEKKRTEMKDEHLLLYSLYGDPALLISYSKGRIVLDVEKHNYAPGEIVAVCTKILGSVSGHIKITLETSREKMAHKLEQWTDKSPERDFIIESNWKKANDKTLKTIFLPYEKGFRSLFFKIPKNIPPGQYVIRAETVAGHIDASGSIRIKIK